MPPDYITIAISDSLAIKPTRIMVCHDGSNYAEAINYVTDTTLIREDEITIRKLVQRRAERGRRDRFTVKFTIGEICHKMVSMVVCVCTPGVRASKPAMV